MRAHASSRTQPRHVEPLVRSVDQRRCNGSLRHTSIPKEIRHDLAVQADLSYCCHLTFFQIAERMPFSLDDSLQNLLNRDDILLWAS